MIQSRLSMIDNSQGDCRSACATQRLVAQDEQGVQRLRGILSQNRRGLASRDCGPVAMAQSVDDAEQSRPDGLRDHPAITGFVLIRHRLPGDSPLDRAGHAGLKHWPEPISS